MESSEINVRSVLEIVSRRRWALVLPLIALLMMAGWLYVVLPRAYRADATLLYQPRALPKDYVQQLSPFSSEDWLRSLTQRITSRERALALATEFGLYQGRPEQERSELVRGATSVELVEAELRKDNPYRASRETPQVSAFTLSFEAPDPKLAAKVTNRLAEMLVAESHTERLRQAAAAGQFIEGELDQAKARLAAQDAQLSQFKADYAGELPEQAPANATALATAQMQLQSLSAQAAEARDKVLRSRQRITELVHGVTGLTGTGPLASEVNPLLAQIQQKREELDSLRARYTKRHPDVIRAQSELAILERKVGGGAKTPLKIVDAVALAKRNPLLKDLAAELEAAESDRRRLEVEAVGERQQVALYQRRLDIAPQRAQQLENLTRDYVAMKVSYEALLNKRLETKMARNLEALPAGDQMSVLNAAVVPTAPFKPSFRKLFVLFTLIGVVLGAMLATIWEFSDDSLRTESDAEGFLKLPVLASVPRLQTVVELVAARRQRARLAMIAAAVAGGYALSLALLQLNGIHLRLPV